MWLDVDRRCRVFGYGLATFPVGRSSDMSFGNAHKISSQIHSGIVECLLGAIMGESRRRVVVCLLSSQQDVLQFHAHLLLEDARVNELFVELSKNLAMAGI